MASHLDLEEQEQIDELKHFWTKWGAALTWVLIAVLMAYSAWTGWQFWQRKQAAQSSILYETVERAVLSQDQALVTRALADMQDKFASATYTQHASLLGARFFSEHQALDLAEKNLVWVKDHAGDEGLMALARLRLSALSMEGQKWDQAREWLKKPFPKAFEPLSLDRLGDIDLQEKKMEDAKTHFQQAWSTMPERDEYRQLIEVKLASLGVDVRALDLEKKKEKKE
jgi:predicted negative regulator of RcsB-dependent stress response